MLRNLFQVPILLTFGVTLFSCAPAAVIIPRPAQLELPGGQVRFGPQVTITGTPDTSAPVQVYTETLERDGSHPGPGAQAEIRLVTKDSLGPEAYELQVAPRPEVPGGALVIIAAKDDAGFFYALQTLRQVLRTGASRNTLPLMTVTDSPRYRWRGSMLDSARHFIPMEYLKKHLVRMAELKLNVFHWHLTDDQGWRFEVPGYPRLTTVGAWRSQSSAIGLEPEVPYNARHQYGGFYSDGDIAEITALAASLHITVVPEVDMPGHMGAALAAYPDLAGSGPDAVKIQEPLASWGIFNLALNPAQEKTYRFVDAVVTRLTQLFPGPYIHIGGDEVLADGSWATDPDCQKVMANEKFSNPAQLVGYFHRRVTEILAAHHRTPVGWEDVIDGYLDQGIRPPTVLQFWKNENYLKAGLDRGHQIVFSPCNRAYLDMFYKAPDPKLWAGYISLEDTYGLDPAQWVPDDRQVLGVEGELWSEYTYKDSILDNRLWPRTLAIAEDGWTPRARKDWGDFSRRVGAYAQVMTAEGTNFNRCEGVSWPNP